MALMQKAKLLSPKTGGFEKPDITPFVPAQAKDAVERVVAAGMKVMYSPDMRDQVQAEIQRDAPVPQKLAEAASGLLLTLDQQSQGGIPNEAIFPAAMELMGESAQMLAATGEPVTQDDYNDAARLMFVILAKKLGGSDEDIMGAAQQMVGDEPDEGVPPEGMPQGMPPQGMPQGVPA